MENRNYFESLKVENPDFLIIILGGNDLKVNVELSLVYEDCARFYNILREFLPDSIIIASQIENRFYKCNNRFGSPSAETFDFMRRHFNRHLKNKPFKDCLLQIQGPNRLDSEDNFRDGVHLNINGLTKYFDIIEGTLSYAYTKKFVNKF